MMVIQVTVRPDLLSVDLIAGDLDLHHTRAGSVAGADEHTAVREKSVS